jgi:hypothetical protein
MERVSSIIETLENTYSKFNTPNEFKISDINVFGSMYYDAVSFVEIFGFASEYPNNTVFSLREIAGRAKA